MLSIIIHAKGLDSAGINNRMNEAGANADEVVIIDDTAISSEQLAARITGAKVLILGGQILAHAANLSAVIAACRNSTAPVAYAPVQIGDDYIDLGCPSVENLIGLLTQDTLWPAAAILMNKSALGQFELDFRGGLAGLMADILIQSMIKGIVIDRLEVTPAFEASEETSNFSLLKTNEQAGLLSSAVNSFNIEELFPNHAWDNHGEEAAAACYHTLAAHFIRFGDHENAVQCLAFSDRLEDSPRSLALRALISNANGETLGAVANMVSSLQQYEVRKNNTANCHYLSFKPENLETVNTLLHAGLAALNKRDNNTAFQRFAEAVFSFDCFYSENGLDRVVN